MFSFSLQYQQTEKATITKIEVTLFSTSLVSSRYSVKHLEEATRFLFFSLLNKSALFNMGDTQQYSTDKPVAFEFLIELEIRNVGF